MMKRILPMMVLIVLIGIALTACGGGSGGDNSNPPPPQNITGQFDGSWNIAIFQGTAPTDTLSIQTSQVVAMQQVTIADDAISQPAGMTGQLSQSELNLEMTMGADLISATGTFSGDGVSGSWSSSSGESGTWEGRKVAGDITDQWEMRKKSAGPIEQETWLMLQRGDGNLLLGHTADDQFYAGTATFDGQTIEGSMDALNGQYNFSCLFFGPYISGPWDDPIFFNNEIDGFKWDQNSDIRISYAYLQYRPYNDTTNFFVALVGPDGNPPPPDIITSVEITDAAGSIQPHFGIIHEDGWSVDGWNCDATCEFTADVYSGAFGTLVAPGSLPDGEYTLTVSTQTQTISQTVTFAPITGLPAPADPVNQLDPDGNLTVTWDPPPAGVNVRLDMRSNNREDYKAAFLFSDPSQTSFTIPAQVLNQMNVSGTGEFTSRLQYKHFNLNADGSSNQSTRTYGSQVPF